MPVESHPNAAKSANVRVGAPRGHWSLLRRSSL